MRCSPKVSQDTADMPRDRAVQLGVALAFGVLLGPAVIVLPIVYSPATGLAALALGALAGTAGPRLQSRSAVLWAAAVGALLAVVAGWMVIVVFFSVSSLPASLQLFSSALFLPLFVLAVLGSIAGHLALSALGRAKSIGAVLTATALLAAAGAGAAMALAPPNVAGAPQCDGRSSGARDCELLTRCEMMAERRRVLTVLRVVQLEPFTCTYTGWGGVHIGTVIVEGKGMSWEDGAYPRLFIGR